MHGDGATLYLIFHFNHFLFCHHFEKKKRFLRINIEKKIVSHFADALPSFFRVHISTAEIPISLQ